MKIWIVWLPNVWKSTLFNALTQSYSADAQNFPFCTIEPNTWIVNVNDDRLEELRVAVDWSKIIPATTEFIDIAGLVKWASTWEWLWNKFLANIRETNAILQVVRGFEDKDIHHVDWNIDPKRDIETINTELIIADLELLAKKQHEYTKKARSNDKDSIILLEIVNNLITHLESWNLAITLGLDEEELELTTQFNLLTNKPFIYAVNLSEDDVLKTESDLRELIWVTDEKIAVVWISAKLELDMMDLDEEDKKEFLEEFGIKENPVDKLIKTAYDNLGLQYYFTAWVQEVRAWTIKKWDLAPVAAWVIHTDFQKKFIKADVVNWKDLVDHKWWSKAREEGCVKMQWKEYVVQDWDVILFKFGG